MNARLHVAIALLVILAVFAVVMGENITITAQKDLQSFILKDAQAEQISTVIPAGTVLAVRGCKDLKHYFMVEVTYQGQDLLLFAGTDAKLDRRAFLRTWSWPLVFSCPG